MIDYEKIHRLYERSDTFTPWPPSESDPLIGATFQRPGKTCRVICRGTRVPGRYPSYPVVFVAVRDDHEVWDLEGFFLNWTAVEAREASG